METESKTEKVAWILAGGAARTVYTAGTLYALCAMQPRRPDIIIACSGSAATSLCYVTGQREILKIVWCDLLATKKFVHFWRFWKIVDIDYLVDIILKRQTHLDMSKVRTSPISIYIPLTNSKNGKVEYFSNRTTLDFWEVLRAAKSVPFFTNLFRAHGIPLNGGTYFDTVASTRYQTQVAKAVQEGATKILILDSWHTGDQTTNFFFSRALAYLRNRKFRRNQLQYVQQLQSFTPPQEVKMFVMSPKEQLDMKPWENSSQKAREVFTRGYKEALENEGLQAFIW